VSSRSFACMHFDRWPAHDQRLWRQGIESLDVLDRPGPGANWRPATRTTVEHAYGHALGWLERTELLEAAASPSVRWTPERLRSYIQHLAVQVRPATVRHRIVNLERALAVLEPHSDRAMFRAAVRSLSKPADRSNKRSRLQEPASLVDLGFRLMQRAETGLHRNARRNAAAFRTGLQVALLAMRPLRMRNFCNIRIGINLVLERDTWWLRFARGDQDTTAHRGAVSARTAHCVGALSRPPQSFVGGRPLS
jgi:integrase/recombinase XerD